jgi:hypothetical protein
MNTATSDLLEHLDNTINALKTLSSLCSSSTENDLNSLYWLLAPIVEKQEQTMADLWKAEAKK